jgi:hypothetical protein
MTVQAITAAQPMMATPVKMAVRAMMTAQAIAVAQMMMATQVMMAMTVKIAVKRTRTEGHAAL